MKNDKVRKIYLLFFPLAQETLKFSIKEFKIKLLPRIVGNVLIINQPETENQSAGFKCDYQSMSNADHDKSMTSLLIGLKVSSVEQIVVQFDLMTALKNSADSVSYLRSCNLRKAHLHKVMMMMMMMMIVQNAFNTHLQEDYSKIDSKSGRTDCGYEKQGTTLSRSFVSE
uniref:Uncharacterized protein n=1 Tax=Glossina pallidipes TaxID=7398 RepID=A0A1B0A1L0_GLOPL